MLESVDSKCKKTCKKCIIFVNKTQKSHFKYNETLCTHNKGTVTISKMQPCRYDYFETAVNQSSKLDTYTVILEDKIVLEIKKLLITAFSNKIRFDIAFRN